MSTPTQSGLHASFTGFAKIVSIAVALIGCIVLAGWWFDIEIFKSLIPGLATMKANTAAAFVLAGVALWLECSTPSQSRAGRRQRMARIGAAVVALAGLLTLSEYFFGWDLGIDQALFRASSEASQTLYPGRMSPATALSVLLIGMALLLLDVRLRKHYPAEGLALVTGVVALAAILGYAYSVQALYRITIYDSMALHTAITFLILALGTLCARPDRGLMGIVSSDSAGGQTARRLLPFAIGSPLLLGWLRLMGQRMGLYDTEFGTALYALSNIAVFMVVIWWNAGHLIRMEAERERAEERFRLVVEAAPSAMIVVDRAGKMILVNTRTQELFGYRREELLGRSVETLVPERFRRQHSEHRANFFADPKARPIGAERDLFGLRKDRSEIPVEIGLAPLEISGAHVVLASIIDIAERKRAEEEIKRTLAELARSNRELEQFAYVASHDLQEPLRIVSSYVQLLARRYRGKLDQDADEFIAFAVEGANRMKALINDLLAFSRVGTRGKELTPVAMDEVFGHALDNLQLAIEESGATVTHDPLPQVMADDVQMTQLLQNLIGNAVKFRSQEPPRVHVGARRQGEQWLFFVRDNGIGIDPQYNERIFIIFQRLHNRDEYGGTGIGLALCRKIVERHGGRIWVESEPGQGATFYFTLRHVDSVAPEAAGPEAAKPRARDSVAERATDLV